MSGFFNFGRCDLKSGIISFRRRQFPQKSSPLPTGKRTIRQSTSTKAASPPATNILKLILP